MNVDQINAGSSETASECKEVTFVKRAGYVLGAGALAVFAVGVVSVYALIGGRSLPKNADTETYNTATTSAVVRSDSSEISSEARVASVSQVALSLKKAGIDEYDLVVGTVDTVKKTAASSVDETVSEKIETSASKKTAKADDSADSKAAETTAAEQTGSSANSVQAADTAAQEPAQSDDIRSCGVMTMYTTDGVNLRQDASLNADVLRVLPVSSEVLVTGYNDDWYRIKADGQTGYCLKRYLSSDRPVQEISTSSVISYTDTEFDMLCYVLQGEVGDCSEASKIAVANVIINRVKSPLFPNSINDVLNQDNQFTAIYGYYNGTAVPSQNTIDCARRALAGEENTNGAVYYYSPQYCGSSTAAWFESLTFCLEVDGQRYFK